MQTLTTADRARVILALRLAAAITRDGFVSRTFPARDYDGLADRFTGPVDIHLAETGEPILSVWEEWPRLRAAATDDGGADS